LLPEAHEQLSEHYSPDYPWAFLLAIGGYLLILFVEKVACDSHSFLVHEHNSQSEETYSYQQEEQAFSEIMINRVKLMKGLSDSQQGEMVDMHAGLLTHYADTKHVQNTGIGAYILAIALSTHAVIPTQIFEGLALGLENDRSALFNLGVAIMVHKFPGSFAVGTTLNRTKMCWQVHAIIAIFVLASPLGVLLAVTVLDGVSKGVSGMLLGATTGTFLYIALSEVIVEEFALMRKNRWKFLASVVGIALIAVLRTFE
jgi:zinc transporter ZupT